MCVQDTMPSVLSRRAIINRWFAAKGITAETCERLTDSDQERSPASSMGDLDAIVDSEGEDVLCDKPPTPRKTKGISRSHSNSFKRGRKKIENFFKGRKWSTNSSPDYILPRKPSTTSVASTVSNYSSGSEGEDVAVGSPRGPRVRRHSSMSSNWSTISVTSQGRMASRRVR